MINLLSELQIPCILTGIPAERLIPTVNEASSAWGGLITCHNHLAFDDFSAAQYNCFNIKPTVGLI